jgi:O-methyltransferase
MSQRVRGRLLSLPSLARLDRVRRLATMNYRTMSRELAYQPGEQFRDELLDLKAFMRRAFQVLVYNAIDGDYAEFGCCGATTFTLAWGAADLVGHKAHLWAFDSFEGLPSSTDPRDAHTGWTEGVMAMTEEAFIGRCQANGVPEQAYTTVPGFYSESLSSGSRDPRPGRICFAYVDCDLYTSTLQALEFLGDRLCHGAVVAFDDYYCFSESHPSGERLAVTEFFANHERWRLVPYIQWGWYGMSFIIEARQSAPAPAFSW